MFKRVKTQLIILLVVVISHGLFDIKSYFDIDAYNMVLDHGMKYSVITTMVNNYYKQNK